ncbi:MAG: putative PEP-binding protein [Acidimicrobiales bacterium]
MGRGSEAAARIVGLVTRALDPHDPLTIAQAVSAVHPGDVKSVLHSHFAAGSAPSVLTTGLPASPGAATGVLMLTADEAIATAATKPVLLVRRETSAEDVVGMQCAQGIVTARGGIASHAAVVARGLGIPAVVGAADIEVLDGAIRIGSRTIAAGEWLSIDGGTGEVFAGAAEVAHDECTAELQILLEWADHLATQRVVVRANADTAADASYARSIGAQGIGLCRTEHMFFAPDRLALLRTLLLARGETDERPALMALEDIQREDFEGILAAMDGLPVAIRLLDAPLHEFFPAHDATVDRDALHGRHEVNPMMGTRGIRLGVIRPTLYRMQVQAICRAALALLEQGRRPQVEILVPMVMDPAETALVRSWVAEIVAATDASAALRDVIHVGTMIETPRAALLAAEVAVVSEGVSFGTNDLTQLVFGLSRDDTDGPLLSQYLAKRLLPANPFETLDARGVGRLVRAACSEARAARPDVTISVCGEHAGDPASIDFLVGCGVDAVSCSAFRIPVARLAVAQSLLRLEQPAVGDPVAPTDADSPASPPSPPVVAHDAQPLRMIVLHALRIKGFTTIEVISELVGLDADTAARELEALAALEFVRFVPARSLWQITAAGRGHHAELLPGVDQPTLASLRQSYGQFLTLNGEFKQLCTDWQVRDDAPNDHDDERYDAACINRLTTLHERTQPVIDAFTAALDRFGLYGVRLTRSWQRVVDGERSQFTGVLCSSYHDVWMELHEDLILMLGIERSHEGSF